MNFSLGDPRLEALSRAGGNFGGGLADALTQYINNAQLSKALNGVTAETPITDVVKAFAKNRVSPEQQQMYFNPVVQGRLGQERAANIFQSFSKMSPQALSKMTWPQATSLIYSAFANSPEGYRAAEPIINNLKAEAQRNGWFGFGGAQNQNQPFVPGQEGPTGDQNISPGSPVSIQPQGTGVKPGIGVSQNQMPPQTVPARGGQQIQPGEVPRLGEATAAPSKEYIHNLVGRYMTPGTSVDEAIKNAANVLNMEESLLKRVYFEQEQQDLVRQKQNLENTRIEQYGEAQSKKDFGTDEGGNVNLPPEYRNLLTDLMLDNTKGSDTQRYTRAKKVITDLMDGVRNLATGEKRPLLAGLRPGAREKFISAKQGQASNILNNPSLPDVYKPMIREQMRTALTNQVTRIQPGIELPEYGPVEIEEIINKPSKELKSVLTSIPAPSKDPRKNEQALTGLWAYVARNSMNSPMMVTQALIDKGYDQDSIRNAYDNASEKGVPFSEYQNNQRAEFLKNPFVPRLQSIFGGDKTLRSFTQQYGLTGQR